ncbi:hypothetical protein D3C80_1638280 [compost metagenome]
MQDEVDVQFQGVQVITAGRVVAHRRHRPVVLAGAQHQSFQRCLLRGGLREKQFDVVVGSLADKARQFRPAEGDAAHARGQVDHPQHMQAATFEFVADAVNGAGNQFAHSACS